MANKYWNTKIKKNFNNAAHSYSNYSFVQKHFANKLVTIIKELEPQNGSWFDLGAGTGYLADLLENNFMDIKVTRIDFSPNMLRENNKHSETILWDLNIDLPPHIDNASLIISSFCFHWLHKPEKKLKKWYDRLIPGGFLIVLFPNNDSFPEWKDTCKKCNIEYSALSLPCIKALKKENEIFLIKEFNYIETFPNIYKLFKSIINVGAHTTQSDRKKISEFKLMQEKWPKDKYKKVNLTWNISVLILKK